MSILPNTDTMADEEALCEGISVFIFVDLDSGTSLEELIRETLAIAPPPMYTAAKCKLTNEVLRTCVLVLGNLTHSQSGMRAF